MRSATRSYSTPGKLPYKFILDTSRVQFYSHTWKAFLEINNFRQIVQILHKQNFTS